MTTNYNETYTQITAQLAAALRTKAPAAPFTYGGHEYNVKDRAERIALVDRISADYIVKHAEYTQAAIDAWAERGGKCERPATVSVNAALLEQLADAVLNEELTDDTAHKSRQYEYPFLSDIQLARREEGVHQRKNEGGQRQVKLTEAGYMATDGRNYGTPKRRELSDNDKMFMDSAVKSRNKERRQRYEAFTGTQPVITYTLTPEEMEARGW